jgi:hypothetical protein
MRTVTAACVPLGRRRIATQQRERQPPCTRRVRTGGVRVAHAVTPPHNDSAPAADDTDTFATLAGKGAVHAPPGHPQSSRYTARCPSIVLCTPCSGMEWGVIEPALRVWLGEAARRASSLRTWRWRVRRSPCPSSPTTHPPYVPRPSAVDHVDRNMLNPTSDLLSHCHRRMYGV